MASAFTINFTFDISNLLPLLKLFCTIYSFLDNGMNKFLPAIPNGFFMNLFIRGDF